MNVIWHNWENIVREMALTQGLDYDLGQVEAHTARRFAQAINAATEVAWKFHTWPACCWFMSALNLVSNAQLSYLEKGYNVLALYDENPLEAWESGTDPRMIPVRETAGNYVPRGTDPATPFWNVRLAPPRFTARLWVAGEYLPGDLVYVPATGMAWRCLARTQDEPGGFEWLEWVYGGFVDTTDENKWVRRNGVLWYTTENHDMTAENEPGFGANWQNVYEVDQHHSWVPQQIPDFLLQAILHGARAWLHETPPLPRSALEVQMEGWLAAEVDNLRYNRRQFWAEGGALQIL